MIRKTGNKEKRRKKKKTTIGTKTLATTVENTRESEKTLETDGDRIVERLPEEAEDEEGAERSRRERDSSRDLHE